MNVIDGLFFYYSFTSSSIQDFIRKSAGSGTVGTFTIDTGKKTPIQLPSIDEQAQIGGFFQRLDSLIALHQRERVEQFAQSGSSFNNACKHRAV